MHLLGSENFHSNQMACLAWGHPIYLTGALLLTWSACWLAMFNPFHGLDFFPFCAYLPPTSKLIAHIFNLHRIIELIVLGGTLKII